jgi:serine/threonine protein kinase
MRVSGRTVKVMDFGLAKNPATSMTHDGALLGTPNYMSPEQVRGESLDGRADLFALGIVCYEMLTGTKPFSGDSISSVLYRIVNEPPKDASEHSDRMGAPLASFLAKALAKDPRARFQDGAAFAAAVRRAGDGADAAASQSRPPNRRGAAKVAEGPAPLRRSRACRGCSVRWPSPRRALRCVFRTLRASAEGCTRVRDPWGFPCARPDRSRERRGTFPARAQFGVAARSKGAAGEAAWERRAGRGRPRS